MVKTLYLNRKWLQHQISKSNYGCRASRARFTISTTCDTISSSYEELLSASASGKPSNAAEFGCANRSVSSSGYAFANLMRKTASNNHNDTQILIDFILTWSLKLKLYCTYWTIGDNRCSAFDALNDFNRFWRKVLRFYITSAPVYLNKCSFFVCGEIA